MATDCLSGFIGSVCYPSACFYRLNMLNQHLTGRKMSEKWYTAICWLSTLEGCDVN